MAPVTVKWVDTNKGGLGEMLVRSRLVARDFKVRGDEINVHQDSAVLTQSRSGTTHTQQFGRL